MWEKLKAYGSWALGVVALLVAVVFGANALKGRKRAQAGNDAAPAGKAPMVEEQAKETDLVNTKVEELNEVKPPPPTPKDKPMEDLINEYEKL